jgi:hypothetical protein
MQWFNKHVSAIEAVFSVGSVQRSYLKNKRRYSSETNIWPWVPAGLDAKSDRAGWLPAVSYCSAAATVLSSRQK